MRNPCEKSNDGFCDSSPLVKNVTMKVASASVTSCYASGRREHEVALRGSNSSDESGALARGREEFVNPNSPSAASREALFGLGAPPRR